jgi:hypothetical protein
MITGTLTKYFGSGPLYKEYFNGDFRCPDTWWYNLLYVNNIFFNTDRETQVSLLFYSFIFYILLI